MRLDEGLRMSLFTDSRGAKSHRLPQPVTDFLQQRIGFPGCGNRGKFELRIESRLVHLIFPRLLIVAPALPASRKILDRIPDRGLWISRGIYNDLLMIS
jgi:hypothetical protein